MPAIAQRIHFNWSGLSVTAVWLLASLVVTWLAAGWFWRITAPASIWVPLPTISDPLLAAQSIASRHLMGDADPSPGKAATPRAAQYELSGAMTASRGRAGFAIFVEPGKAPFPVLEGEEIAPGTTLVKVLANKVEIRRQGRSETLEMNDNPPRPAAASPRAAIDTARPTPVAGGNETASDQAVKPQ